MAAVEALRRRPFLVVAAPFAAGIAVSSALDQPALLWISIALLPLAFVRRLRSWALIGLVLGITRAEVSRLRPATDISRLDADVEARITGTVLESPRFFSSASGTFPLEITAVEVAGRPTPWTGRVRVQFYRAPPPLEGGEGVSIEGRLRRVLPPTNPGVFDRTGVFERLGLGAVVSTSKPVTVVSNASPFRFSTWTDRARKELRGLLARHARPDVAALQSALLFGSREELPSELTTSLQRSGTAHFLAVSGFNLVLVLVIFWFVLLAIGIRGPSVPAGLLVILFAYTALTGWQVSVVRAFLMSAAVLGARLVWRRSDVVNSLCVAGLAILLWDPAQLFDTGFQLSFVAVLGIVGIGPIYHEFLAPPPGPSQRAATAWLGRQSRGALGVSIGAWLATAPIVLATFNLVTPVILVANLALCPLVTVQSFLALATVPAAVAVPPAATLLGTLATGIFEATAWSAGFLTSLPCAYVFLPPMPAWAVVSYYAALGAWTWRARVRPDRRKPWLCAVFAASLALPPLLVREPEVPVVGLMDVGRGSAAYVRIPGQGVTLFDCGSLSYRDPGAMVTAPVLWSQGITRAHTLVLSHADSDHVNGAQSVIERMGVRRLVVPAGFAHPVLTWARRRGVEIVEASRGSPVPGLEILGPPPGAGAWPPNERSLVCRIGNVLFPGDIEELGTRALLDAALDLRADVLVLPHHGKLQALHRELIEAVRPRLVLVSAPDGYASREVLDRARAGAVVYQTGLGGWIEAELGSPRVRQFQGE